jgi:ribosomal protein S14
MLIDGLGQKLLLSPLRLAEQVRFRYQYLRNKTRVRRDILRRPAVAEFEIKRAVYKALHRDQRLPLTDRLRAMLGLHSMHSYTISNAIKARCVFGGRGTGILPGYRVSRIVFRESGINGRLPGAMRAHW